MEAATPKRNKKWKNCKNVLKEDEMILNKMNVIAKKRRQHRLNVAINQAKNKIDNAEKILKESTK